MNKKKWKAINVGFLEVNNLVLQSDGFYISYNSNVRSNFTTRMIDNLLHSMLGEDKNYTGEETALVKKGKDNKYYILNGDFRKGYEKVFSGGFKACYEFFKDNEKKHGSFIDKQLKR